MSDFPAKSLRGYADLLRQVKLRIRQAQTRAILSANAEMIRLYWDIGHLVLDRQQAQGWGTSVIPRLSRDIRNELPEVKGFSERNIGYMIRFAREYPILHQPGAKLLPDSKRPKSPAPGMPELPILHQVGAKLAANADTLRDLVVRLPWKHNVLLFEKIDDLDTRLWYMRQTIQNGWSRNVLEMMIDTEAHLRQGKSINNFADQLPPAQSDLAVQALKDPYIFDFLTLEEPFHERELETELLRHLEKFLIELGQGFALRVEAAYFDADRKGGKSECDFRLRLTLAAGSTNGTGPSIGCRAMTNRAMTVHPYHSHGRDARDAHATHATHATGSRF